MKDRISKIMSALKGRIVEGEADNVSRIIEQALESEHIDFESRLREFLTGGLELATAFDVRRRLEKGMFCVLAVVHGKSSGAAVLDYLVQLSEGDIVCRIDSKTICYLKRHDATDDYRSANEFASLLCEQIQGELGKTISVGIGGVAQSAADIPRVFAQAQSAFRLGRLTGNNANVHSYKELLTLKILEDIPQDTLRFYLSGLADAATLEILADAELMHTAREFLDKSLNISETSRSMFLHRNAIIYRLDKIENATGLNIRRFADAVTFRTIMILYKIIKDE